MTFVTRAPSGESPWRRMTLAEAQAIECNRCGDCCDSRRAMLYGNIMWSWGSHATGPMIIPLRLTSRWGMEDDLPSSQRPGRLGYFRCAALEVIHDEYETARCTIHGDEAVPATCREFPVYGSDGAWIAEVVAKDGEYAIGAPERCSWYRVLVVA